MTHSNNTMEREIERLKQERIKLQHTLNQHQCAIQTRGGSSSQRPGSSLQGNSRPGLSQNMRPASSAMRPPSSSGFMLQNQQNRENTRKDERSGENVRRIFCTYKILLISLRLSLDYVTLIDNLVIYHLPTVW